MPVLTIFTPTWNRAHTLGRVYASLCAQECRDFVWLIVDDGSTDGTKFLAESWQRENNGFEIRYIYKENGGMHTAHNTAYENIDTELNLCIDSDDALAPGAVRLILEKWEAVRKKGYAGMIGLDAYMETEGGGSRAVIGKGFPDGMTETTLTDYYAQGGRGDKKLVYRTDVIREVPPYPVFEGERYLALAYKYRLIDRKYKLAVLDEVLCLVDYREDGSTKNMLRQYLKNPNGFAFWRRVCMEEPTGTKRLVMDCIHYVSSSILSHDREYIRRSPVKLLTVLLTPAGALLTLYIRYCAGVKNSEV